jgi:hypothetical protein
LGDSFAPCLYDFFDSNFHIMPLLIYSIKYEIANTVRLGELFRKNSLPLKLISQFGRMKGEQYVRETLQPILLLIAGSTDSCEIQTEKLKILSELPVNIERLTSICATVLNSILQSVTNIPM